MENNLERKINLKLEHLKKRQKVFKIIKQIIIYALLTFWALLVLFPFYWMIFVSFRVASEYGSEITHPLFSFNLTFDNYIKIWQNTDASMDLARFMLNTLVFATITTALMLVVTVLAAFAFARLDFYGKNILFTIFLAMMMIPNELVIITNYITVGAFNMYDTFAGLILPSILSIFYIYLLRQNFMQVPDDMYYAAKVDGTSDFGYLTKVLLPLSKPTIITIVILKFIECWNSYVWPRAITKNENYFLVSMGIQSIRTSTYGDYGVTLMMAAAFIMSVPLLVAFIIFRKQIMAGVSRTGTKG